MVNINYKSLNVAVVCRSLTDVELPTFFFKKCRFADVIEKLCYKHYNYENLKILLNVLVKM